jgi:hypothetical protein
LNKHPREEEEEEEEKKKKKKKKGGLALGEFFLNYVKRMCKVLANTGSWQDPMADPDKRV